MGHTNLMILVLMIAVGGIAVVMSLDANTQRRSRAEATATASEGVAISSKAQVMRSKMMGAGASPNLDNTDFYRAAVNYKYGKNAFEVKSEGQQQERGSRIKLQSGKAEVLDGDLSPDADAGEATLRIKRGKGRSKGRVLIYTDGNGGFIGVPYKADSPHLGDDDGSNYPPYPEDSD